MSQRAFNQFAPCIQMTDGSDIDGVQLIESQLQRVWRCRVFLFSRSLATHWTCTNVNTLAPHEPRNPSYHVNWCDVTGCVLINSWMNRITLFVYQRSAMDLVWYVRTFECAERCTRYDFISFVKCWLNDLCAPSSHSVRVTICNNKI